MSRFTSIPYDVDAVLWKGEVTPEISDLFKGRDVVTKSLGSPLLAVPVVTGTRYAKIGEWVVRYPDDNFDVSDDDDFQSMYEVPRSTVDMGFGIPLTGVPIATVKTGTTPADFRATLTNGSVVCPGGEGVGEVRVKVKMDSSISLEMIRQIVGCIEDPSTIASVAGHLISRCDQQGLAILKDLIGRMERLNGDPS